MTRLAQSPFSIRRARPADALGIARVHVASWQAAYEDVIPPADIKAFTFERRATQWQRILDSDAQAWVALEDDLVVGFTAVRGDEITVLYLHPGWWRLGLGRQLLRAALGSVRRTGHELATLWVLEENRGARAFYSALAGVEMGQRMIQIGRTTLGEIRVGWAFSAPGKKA